MMVTGSMSSGLMSGDVEDDLRVAKREEVAELVERLEWC